MKYGTTDHPKFSELQVLLGNPPKYAVVGLLECLWMTTAKWKPDGDIGRFTNAQIAQTLGWDKDPDDLINALVETGWIDTDSACRLCIHDWIDHRPTYISDRFRKRSKSPKNASSDAKNEPFQEIPGNSRKFRSQPIQSNPNQSNPNQSNLPQPPSGAEGDPPGFVKFWKLWPSNGEEPFGAYSRKQNRSGCLRKWRRSNLEPKATEIVAGLRRWKASVNWMKDRGEFVPLPLSWMNQQGWKDAPLANQSNEDDGSGPFIAPTEEQIAIFKGEA